VLVEVRKRSFSLHLPSAFPHLPRVVRFNRGTMVSLSPEMAAHWFIKGQLQEQNLVVVEQSPGPNAEDRRS
jgi:hypothetical protein